MPIIAPTPSREETGLIIPENATAGEYKLEIKAYYNDNDYSFKELSLFLGECKETKATVSNGTPVQIQLGEKKAVELKKPNYWLWIMISLIIAIVIVIILIICLLRYGFR